MWLFALPWPESARIRLPRERRLFPWHYRPADTARLAEILAGMVAGVERHVLLPWPAVRALAPSPEPERWEHTLLVAVVQTPGVSVRTVDDVLDRLGAPNVMVQLSEPADHGYGWQEQHVKRALLRHVQRELSAPDHALASFGIDRIPTVRAAALAADALDFVDLVEAAIAHRLENAAEGFTEEHHLRSLWWAAGRLVAERLLRIRPDGVPGALTVVLRRGKYDRSDERQRTAALALQTVGLARVVGGDVSLGPLARAVVEEPAVLAAMRERIPELPGESSSAGAGNEARRTTGHLLAAPAHAGATHQGELTDLDDEAGLDIDVAARKKHLPPYEGDHGEGAVAGTEMLLRVEEALQLQGHKGKEIERRSAPAPFGAHLAVKSADSFTARPWAAVPGDVDEALLTAFLRDIDAPYRLFDPGLVSTLIHDGQITAREVAERAQAEHVRLLSFGDLQRSLMDIGPYLAEQTRWLENDPLYSPKAYVDQRILLSADGEARQHDRAIEALFDVLSDEQGRFVLVLGDFGTGKTFLLHELARRMAISGSTTWPVLVNLRELEKTHQLDALLGQHFAGAGVPFDARVFRYLLREGHIALFFDGFDELALRVRYTRAAAHLETLLQAAEGRAKVVVTSRTQHFVSDTQVKTALAERVEQSGRRTVARLLPFNKQQMAWFLERQLGHTEQASRRLALIEQVKDLAGLSENPRMLSFIAALPEGDLLAARDRQGQISAASLYRRLLERWFEGEEERVGANKGTQEGLTTEERWRAVESLALHLWTRTETSVAAAELPHHVARALQELSAHDLDHETAAHQVGSATLLVRDADGQFSFLHLSVMEWLVANAAAEVLGRQGDPVILQSGEMSALMADFLIDLSPHGGAVEWARVITQGDFGDVAKRNALVVLRRAGVAVERADYRGKDLRGQDFSGQDLTGADFTDADLSEARLAGAILTGAVLRSARLNDASLEGAVLTNADLTRADLSRARLSGADLTGAELTGAMLYRAKLPGVKVGSEALARAGSLVGASTPPRARPQAMHETGASPCNAVVVWRDLIASGHEDGSIQLWDRRARARLRVLPGHNGAVHAIAFSPDGTTLTSGSADTSIRVWDISSGRLLRSLNGHSAKVSCLAYIPGGTVLASGSEDRSLRLWDLHSGKLLRLLTGHSAGVNSVAIHPDGQTLASGSRDKSLRLWGLSSSKPRSFQKWHDGEVLSVAFSPDGRTLASGARDGQIRLWELSSGKLTHWLTGHVKVTSVAFSPDGNSLASVGLEGSIRLWDPSSGARLGAPGDGMRRIRSIAFSSDGSSLAAGTQDGSIILFDPSSERSLDRMTARSRTAMSVVFSPEGHSLTASTGRWICLWDPATGRLPRQLVLSAPHRCTALSPDGTVLALGSRSVQLLDVSSGCVVESLDGPSKRIVSLAFNPHRNLLAAGSEDRLVDLWDLESLKLVHSLVGHSRQVASVSFSPDGNTLASGSYDASIRLWDVASGELLASLEAHSIAVASVAFSPDGHILASGSHDRTIRLWDPVSGELVRSLPGHFERVTSVTFSPDGSTLTSGSKDNSVRFWNPHSGQLLAELTGHSNGVTSVAFHPSGRYLAAACGDGSIHLWRLSDATRIAVLYHAEDGWAAYRPDGRYKAGGKLRGSFWHVIGLCRFEPGELDPYIAGLRMANDEPLDSTL